MIDICPVGALTSKPFRYSARTWELSRRKSVSPHDSTGANLIVQVKNNKAMRVVPFENDAVNECWISDRDRFSYEALNSDERLTSPMIKQDGVWMEVDWTAALEYVANGLRHIKSEFGANAVGFLASPHATVEELSLAGTLMRGFGSDNIDYRLRNAEFNEFEGVRHLGRSVASLSTLKQALVIGSRLRKDHPLFAQRIRQAARSGCKVDVIASAREFKGGSDWAMPVRNFLSGEAQQWGQLLANVAAAVAADKGLAPPVSGTADAAAKAIAASLGEGSAMLLGNAAAHHANASSLLAIANWIAAQTGASVGYLTEAGNTVGAQLVGAQPKTGGMHAGDMLAGKTKALLLLNVEPGRDTSPATLDSAGLVVSMSPFKANMDVADVMLPIAPFTETSGSFVNAEGLLQSFHAVVKPLGETRPAWKLLRVLCNMFEVPGVQFETSQEVLASTGLAPGLVDARHLSNATKAALNTTFEARTPVVAGIYELDGVVRRAAALQHTVDAKQEMFA